MRVRLTEGEEALGLAELEEQLILGEDPVVHPRAKLSKSHLGNWCFVDEGVEMLESSLGDYSYVMRFSSLAYTSVGKFCSIASFTRLNPGNHPMDRVTTHHLTYRRTMYRLDDLDEEAFFQWRRSNSVEVGHDVWIGHGAIVLPGVKIATGAVVGAGSVVTKNVAPYQIVAGVPAKTIRARFRKEVAERLMATAWWDWPRELLERRWEDFDEVELFLEKYGPS